MPHRPIGALSQFALAAALAVGTVVLSAPFAATQARADFRVCNGTQSLVGVAIGYRNAEGWVSEGWWRIPATTCRSVIEGELASRFYYLYAEDSDGVGRWGGEIDLCIAENEFKVVGVQDCFSRGFQEMGFREYDTGSQASWMVQLTPPARADETAAVPQETAPAELAPTPEAAAPPAGETPPEETQDTPAQ